MTLELDDRRRAMLAEMGLAAYLPPPVAQVDAARTPAAEVAAAPVSTSADAPAPPRRPAVALEAPRPGPTPAVPAVRPATPALDWAGLTDTIAACRACGLCHTRRNTVPGAGDTQADWLIVGDAPGEGEDLQGTPFAGPDGQLLDSMLKAVGLDRQNKVFLTNLLKCRPPANRVPEAAEVQQCEAFLRRQVELLQPRIILAMGRFAVQVLAGTDEPLGRLRGRPHQYHGVPVIVTYPPASLLRHPADKAKAWADLCLALDVMDGTYAAPAVGGSAASGA